MELMAFVVADGSVFTLHITDNLYSKLCMASTIVAPYRRLRFTAETYGGINTNFEISWQ